jgi:hypothetical protein
MGFVDRGNRGSPPDARQLIGSPFWWFPEDSVFALSLRSVAVEMTLRGMGKWSLAACR